MFCAGAGGGTRGRGRSRWSWSWTYGATAHRPLRGGEHRYPETRVSPLFPSSKRAAQGLCGRLSVLATSTTTAGRHANTTAQCCEPTRDAGAGLQSGVRESWNQSGSRRGLPAKGEGVRVDREALHQPGGPTSTPRGTASTRSDCGTTGDATDIVPLCVVVTLTQGGGAGRRHRVETWHRSGRR